MDDYTEGQITVLFIVVVGYAIAKLNVLLA